MKITQVEKQKKNPYRFNVFLDGNFAFGADEDLVVDRRLIVGKIVSAEDLQILLEESEIGKLMERMYGLLGRRQRSEKEIRDYLKQLSFKRKTKDQGEITDLIAQALIEKLKKKGLLNDLEFAKAWTASRRRSGKKGINLIKSELFQKGIDKEIIEQVLSEHEGGSEENLAKQALEKKMKVWKNLPQLEFKQKALQFLMRRGFNYDIAKEVVENIMKEGV